MRVRKARASQRRQRQVCRVRQGAAPRERSGEQSDLGRGVEGTHVKAPEFLTVDQVAEMLKRKPGGIRKAAQLGRLPFPRKDTYPTKFLRSDVERWMESRSTVR